MPTTYKDTHIFKSKLDTMRRLASEPSGAIVFNGDTFEFGDFSTLNLTNCHFLNCIFLVPCNFGILVALLDGVRFTGSRFLSGIIAKDSNIPDILQSPCFKACDYECNDLLLEETKIDGYNNLYYRVKYAPAAFKFFSKINFPPGVDPTSEKSKFYSICLLWDPNSPISGSEQEQFVSQFSEPCVFSYFDIFDEQICQYLETGIKQFNRLTVTFECSMDNTIDFYKVNFTGCSFENTTFKHLVILSGASLINSNFENSIFWGGASISLFGQVKTKLQGANFSNAVCESIILTDTQVHKPIHSGELLAEFLKQLEAYDVSNATSSEKILIDGFKKLLSELQVEPQKKILGFLAKVQAHEGSIIQTLMIEAAVKIIQQKAIKKQNKQEWLRLNNSGWNVDDFKQTELSDFILNVMHDEQHALLLKLQSSSLEEHERELLILIDRMKIKPQGPAGQLASVQHFMQAVAYCIERFQPKFDGLKKIIHHCRADLSSLVELTVDQCYEKFKGACAYNTTLYERFKTEIQQRSSPKARPAIPSLFLNAPSDDKGPDSKPTTGRPLSSI